MLMNKIVDDFEKYESVMRQMRKVLIRKIGRAHVWTPVTL